MHGCRICAEYLDLDLDQAGSLLHRKRLCRDGAAALTPAAWSAAVPQAQTFTPKYDFKRQFTAALTPRLVKALATQELCLEVWHHSPRTQVRLPPPLLPRDSLCPPRLHRFSATCNTI